MDRARPTGSPATTVENRLRDEEGAERPAVEGKALELLHGDRHRGRHRHGLEGDQEDDAEDAGGQASQPRAEDARRSPALTRRTRRPPLCRRRHGLEDLFALGTHRKLAGVTVGDPHLAAQRDDWRPGDRRLDDLLLAHVVGEPLVVAALGGRETRVFLDEGRGPPAWCQVTSVGLSCGLELMPASPTSDTPRSRTFVPSAGGVSCRRGCLGRSRPSRGLHPGGAGRRATGVPGCS